jgi:hypothetical protein
MEDVKRTLMSMTGISRYVFQTPTRPAPPPRAPIPFFKPEKKYHVDPIQQPWDTRWDWLRENPQSHAIPPFSRPQDTRAQKYTDPELR